MGALHEVAGRNGKDLPLDLRSNGYHPSRAQLGLKLNSEFEESCSSSSSRIPIVSQSDKQNKLVAGHRSLCGHGIPMHRERARGRFQISGIWVKSRALLVSRLWSRSLTAVIERPNE